MQLNYSEIKLLTHVLTTTGETEMGQDGKETLSPRRLNGEESAQRRHFVKAVKDIVENTEKTVRELSDAHNAVVKEVREEKEKSEKKGKKDEKVDMLVAQDERVKESFMKVTKEVNELSEKKHEVELTAKTTDVIKKYFKEFGDKVGFAVGDDGIVESLTTLLQ